MTCTMVQALNAALARAMAEDERVIALGEDVGVDGGVFRVTDGLLDRFGAERVLDTPLAEAVIAGLSVGAAAQGLRPVAEIQFMGFIYPAIDQMVCHASRLRWRTRGRLTCPMVLRAPYGGGIRAIEHHSESTEAMFAHVPGAARRDPVVAGAGLRLAAGRDSGSGSGRLPRAEAHLPRGAGGGGRRRGPRHRSTPASRCARAATSRWSRGAR